MLRLLRHRLGQLLIGVASVMLAVNIAVLLYGVLARYLIGHSPIWMDELSRYLTIATVLFSAGFVWQIDEHMRVAFLERKLPGRMRLCLETYLWLATVILCGYAAWVSLHYALSLSHFKTLGLGVSKMIPMLSLPVGFTCLTLLSLIQPPWSQRPMSETGD